MPKAKPKSKRRILKGWGEIAEFLGQTVSVAQRWQKSGMPVTREGRSVYAFSEALTAWVGTERGKKEPVHIAAEGEDLLADLKQGLSYVRRKHKIRKSWSGRRVVICSLMPMRSSNSSCVVSFNHTNHDAADFTAPVSRRAFQDAHRIPDAERP